MNYYQILQVDRNATTKQIKKHYYKLARQYHPDKHNGDINKCEEFKLLSEAYTTLSNPKKRYLYDMKIDYNVNEEFDLHFTEQDYELLHSYYEKIMNSTEVKFIKILYKSLPEHIRENVKNKMKYKYNNIFHPKKEEISTELIYENVKTIDASHLIEDYTINLCLKFHDIYENNFKQIKIITEKRSYHLFITAYNYRIKIKTDNSFLIINILGDLQGFRVKNYDLIYEQEINLYQYYYGDYFPFHLGETDIMIKNSKNNTHTIKYLGLKDPIKNCRGDLYVLFKVNIDKHNLESEEDKQLVEVLFN